MFRWIAAAGLSLVFSVCTCAQQSSLSGAWQGIFHPGPQQFRVVLQVERSADGQLTAAIYSPDQGPEPLRVSAFRVEADHITFSVPEVGATWSGVLAPDGKLLRGTVDQGGRSELDLARVAGAAVWVDPRIHGSSRLVSVEPGVQLQVIDWGGSGRPLLLLTGLGNTAHIYDRFAQKLTSSYHVFGITRRGFGESSKPTPDDLANYTADRLGDDVVAVIHALGLNKPVLMGHSIAGEELSDVANRHPEAASALVYLDAGFPYAFYDPVVGDYNVDLVTLQRQLSSLLPGANGAQDVPGLLSTIEAELPIFQRELGAEREMRSVLPASPTPPPGAPGARSLTPGDAIIRGVEKFRGIPLPTLAIFAVPHDVHGLVPDGDPEKLRKAEVLDLERTSTIAASFAKGVPSATVIRLPHADHYVFLSNEADVLAALHTFLATHP